MQIHEKTIREMSVDEREETFGMIVRILEGTAREAFVEGDKAFATLSSNMAQAIRINADELSKENLDAAEKVLEQAEAVISKFQAARPYRMISMAIH